MLYQFYFVIMTQIFQVEKIVDSKRIKGKLHYLIRWKGYSADNDTWEPENTLSCPELINKYNDEVRTTVIMNSFQMIMIDNENDRVSSRIF